MMKVNSLKVLGHRPCLGCLTVGGSLYLSGTPITKLPDNLKVGGDLDLSGSHITTLPDWLRKQLRPPKR